jgi:putative sigma-54 modulation protein
MESTAGEYPIILSGIHIELTDAIRNIVCEKMTKLFKHEPTIVRLRVELIREAHKVHREEFTAKAHIEIHGPDIVVGVTSHNLYEAVDELVDHLDRKLRRRSRRMKVKRKQSQNA